jgi:hypothetical protein
MESSEASPSHATESPSSTKPATRLRNSTGFPWDLVSVVLLMLAATPPIFLWRRALTVVANPNLLDDSWVLDTSFKASRGIWLGRDVAFTYGPLFQWLASAPSRWLGLSMGTIYATTYLPLLWGTLLCSYLSLRLLLPEQPAWKRCILLLLLCVFWSPGDLRHSIAILLFAGFLRGWYWLGEGRVRPVVFASAAASSCAVAFLFSADTGVYALAAFALSLFGVAIDNRGERLALRCFLAGLLVFVACSFVLVLLINAAVSRPLDFRYWRVSLLIVSAYRWIEPATMTRAGKVHLYAASLVGVVVFAVRAATRRASAGALTSRYAFLIGAFLLSLVTLQSGLVRSDEGHIALAVFALLFFSGAILFAIESRPGTWITMALAVIAAFVLGNLNPMFLPSDVARRFAGASHTVNACPPGTAEFSRACFPPPFAALLQSGAQFAQQNTPATDSIVVFPYQTIFGIASQRNVAGGLMQGYLATGSTLSQVELAGLEPSRPPVAFYLPDGDLSLPIDGVHNFTRSPEVWLWLVQHYRADQIVAPGLLGLKADDDRARRLALEFQPIGLAASTFPIAKRSTLLDLGDITLPASADFLRLRITVRYPPWWILRKPQRLQLEISRLDGSRELKSFVVPPNQSADAWFYAWDENGLANYFDADDSRWRAVPRSPVVHLRLWVTPMDWVSVVPRSVDIEAADGVQLIKR